MRPIPFSRLCFFALGVLLFLAVSSAPADAQSRFNVLRMAPENSVPPPDFQYPDLTGKHHKLSDFKGKVVILAFFATWCPLCEEEMPKLSALQKKYGDQGFTVLAVSVDRAGPGFVQKWAKNKKLNYPIFHDQTWSSRRTHNVRYVPTVYLIDRDQQLVAWVVGVTDWSSDQASGIIRRILQRKSAAHKPTTQTKVFVSSR